MLAIQVVKLLIWLEAGGIISGDERDIGGEVEEFPIDLLPCDRLGVRAIVSCLRWAYLDPCALGVGGRGLPGPLLSR